MNFSIFTLTVFSFGVYAHVKKRSIEDLFTASDYYNSLYVNVCKKQMTFWCGQKQKDRAKNSASHNQKVLSTPDCLASLYKEVNRVEKRGSLIDVTDCYKLMQLTSDLVE